MKMQRGKAKEVNNSICEGGSLKGGGVTLGICEDIVEWNVRGWS